MTTDERKAWMAGLIGRRVQIDSTGKTGKIVSVNVTSDGFVMGRTQPGYDRGVFLGRAPWAHNVGDR